MEKSDLDKAGGEDDNATRTPRKGYKRRFPHSFEGRGGESKTKKAKTTGSSSKSAADAVMVRRLGGTQSDPLNLLGTVKDLDQCSSCMSSPTQEAGQPPPPPPLLQHDPLNLEGKVRDDLSVLLKGEDKPGALDHRWRNWVFQCCTCFNYFPAEKQKHKDVARKHRRTRTLSTEEHVRPEEEAGASAKADQRVYHPFYFFIFSSINSNCSTLSLHRLLSQLQRVANIAMGTMINITATVMVVFLKMTCGSTCCPRKCLKVKMSWTLEATQGKLQSA